MKNFKSLGITAIALAGGITTGLFSHGTLSDPPSRIYRAWEGGCMTNPDPFLQGLIDEDVDA